MYIHFDSDNYSIYYNSTDTSSDDETSIIMVDQDDDGTVETDIDDDIVDNGYNTDDSYNTDEGIEYDSIHNEDSQHFYSEKENGKYYLGLCHVYSQPNRDMQLLLSTSVSARTFFNHSYENINNYLYSYGLVRIPNHEVQLMQVHMLDDDTCMVVNKTYWLRIIQRRWKKTYAMRIQMARLRAMPENQIYNQIHGYYPNHIRIMPSFRDMAI
jgi:hypothetical protein